jgi:hypothetical protein
MTQWLPGLTWLMDILRINSRTHYVRKLIKLNMNAVSLAVGVRTQLLFRRQLEF